MAKIESVYTANSFSRIWLVAIFAVLAAIVSSPDSLRAQSAGGNSAFARRQTFGFFFAYSGDSSHILLGVAEDRRLLHVGATYSRRLLLNRMLNWQYNGELMPVVLESDPVQTTTTTVNYANPPMTLTGTFSVATAQACHPASGSETLPNGDTFKYTITCSRRWSIGQAMSPVGFEWNLLPQHRLQPFLIGHGGYMYSTQQVPVSYAGSFNFTFDFGAGLELYRSHRRSIRAEYRYHHLSNYGTAVENPGVDSGLLQVTYCFGR